MVYVVVDINSCVVAKFENEIEARDYAISLTDTRGTSFSVLERKGF